MIGMNYCIWSCNGMKNDGDLLVMVSLLAVASLIVVVGVLMDLSG